MLIERAADEIREGIVKGRWHGHMPGIHQLRLEMDFGRIILEKALTQLTHEGLIARADQGRRRAILGLPSREREHTGLRLALILPYPWKSADREDVEFVGSLQLAIERAGFSLTICSCGRGAKKLEGLRELMNACPPDALAVYQGTRELIGECRRMFPRTLALGGPVADLDMDVVAWDGGVLIKRSLEILFKAGHRRIVLPLIRTWRDGVHRGVAAFHHEMARAGIPIQPSFHLPPVPDGPDGFHRLLENSWRWTPPTAFIVHTAAQVVDILCFSKSRGLSVPNNLSVIALCANPILRELQPTIASLELDNAKLVPHVVNWLIGPPAPPRKVLLQPSLALGESVASRGPGATRSRNMPG